MNVFQTVPKSPPLVLVTGATGFVGRNLIPALVKQGIKVRAASRDGRAVLGAVEAVATGDIQTTIWEPLLERVDCVVHLAARAHRRAQVQERERDLYFRTNVDVTAALGEAARAAGVRHIIFTSSIAVLGSNTTGRSPFSSSDKPLPKTVYGRSKLAAEEKLRNVAALAPGMMLDILRPTMIVGPEAPGNLQILAAALRRGLPLPLASIRNQRMFLSIESLIGFLLTRLTSFEPGTHTFTLADADGLSTPQVVSLLAEGIGVRPRLMPFPPALLGLMLRLLRRPDKADALTKSLEIDIGAARATGWAPTADIAQALRQSFASAKPGGRIVPSHRVAFEKVENAR